MSLLDQHTQLPTPADAGRRATAEKPRLFEVVGQRANPRVDWVEIKVKSVLNRVQGMPFKWSINPYRGCAHACVYCVSGDTPILMADGGVKPLQDLSIGDATCGTARDGWYRRYVPTQVLAHWCVEKPAYRIVLEDGTELIASGDHRFLTDRGWKFVTGSEHGRARRPHLTTGNKLMGVGALASPPLKDSAYQRGYLCGVIRGDATLRSYHYDRAGRRHGNVHQFRLAMTDGEALRRAERYLLDFSIATHSFVFQEASASTRRMQAIRTSARTLVEDIGRIVEWPSTPASGWCRGFLAGIFDAEGCYSNGILRITNTDPRMIEWIARCFQRFDFDVTIEERSEDRAKRIRVVRLLGGLREHLRFFLSVDPAIVRKRGIAGQAVKNRASLGVTRIEPVGVRRLFDITTDTGDFIANGVVSHNCFARVTHWYLNQDGVNDWSSRIFVKVNAPEVLRRELARPSWQHEQVHLGTATDPYQPAEGAYRLTRQILEALRDSATPAALVTKSTMVVRDRDVLRTLARGPGAMVMFSITTVDPRLAQEIEPDVPPPQKRLEALRALVEAGIPAGVLLAPVLPGITDDEDLLAAVVEAAKAHGASALYTNALHLGDVTKQAFFDYLEHKRPELLAPYTRLYRGKYAPRAYQQRVKEVVAAIKARMQFTPGERREPPLAARPAAAPPTPEPVRLVQTRLW